MSSADPVVRIEAASKAYGRQQVLHDVSLEIARGESMAIVGTSGSGKSTLLNIMGGLDTGYSGKVTVLGNELRSMSDSALSRFRNRHVGFVFQAFNLLDHLSVLENVELPAYFAGPGARAAGRGKQLLEKVGLGGREAASPAVLSGGQKQRVAIARALYREPELLLCDEPTGNLDTDTGRQIIELFTALNKEGLTLVIVTHEERVSKAARRVLRLKDGQLVPEVAA